MELNGQIQNGGSLVGSFGYETGDYNLLSNKPQINGVELVGNKTSEDLHITGGGTDDYNDLDNKPMINGVQLSGNLSPEDLGLAEINFPDDPTLYLNGSGEFTEPDYFSGDYDDLSHRPQINGVTLTGNKTSADLELEPAIDYPHDATQFYNGNGEFAVPDYFSGDYEDLDNKPQINGVTLTGNQSSADLNIYTPSEVGAAAKDSQIHFETQGSYNLLHAIADYKYTQDLHGYSKPWAPGAGKNKFDVSTPDYPSTLIDSSGNLIASNYFDTWEFPGGVKYVLSLDKGSGFDALRYALVVGGVSTRYATSTVPVYIDATAAEQVYICLGKTDFGTNVMLEEGEAATDYEPYSNICPITGVTSTNITIAPTSDPGEGETYTINFGSDHYEGEVDASTGQIIDIYGYIASYAGETLPGAWVSDRDLYTALTPTPTTGAEVIYELNQWSYTAITPTKIITNNGDNYMWSSTGDIYAQYAIVINDPVIEYLLNER